MSVRKRYGLEFNKLTTDGVERYGCIRKDGIVDQNNDLQFLNYLDIFSTEFLLREINSYLNTAPDPNWTTYESMVLEHIELYIEYPNFRIDNTSYTYPLTDIKNLLEEWLVFLKN